MQNDFLNLLLVCTATYRFIIIITIIIKLLILHRNYRHNIISLQISSNPQYVEGDCTLRYEYLHKQLMKPTVPQNEDEFKVRDNFIYPGEEVG